MLSPKDLNRLKVLATRTDTPAQYKLQSITCEMHLIYKLNPVVFPVCRTANENGSDLTSVLGECVPLESRRGPTTGGSARSVMLLA